MAEEGNVPSKSEKKLYQKGWFWIVIIAVFVIGASSMNQPQDQASNADTSNNSAEEAKVEVKEPEEKKPEVPAEYVSALTQADTYSNTMHMSKQGLYDQLVSEYGGQFSVKAAKYAINNVKADWNANALAKAKSYQDDMHQSPAAIHDQLTSEYGEKFTQAEADYAIKHLND